MTEFKSFWLRMGLLYRNLTDQENASYQTVEGDIFYADGVLRVAGTLEDYEEWQELQKLADEPMPQLTAKERIELDRTFLRAALKSSPELVEEVFQKSPSLESIMHYEVNSCWWSGLLGWKWLQMIAGMYFAYKVQRKYTQFYENTNSSRKLYKIAGKV